MKKCPHCGHTLGFGAFMLRYGSDTLVSHSADAHPREHLCAHCHRKVWLHYSHIYFKRLIQAYLVTEVFLAGIITILVLNAGLRLDGQQTAGFVLILLFLSTPFAVAYAKYRSLVVHQEKTPLRPDAFKAVNLSK
jgi:hypothetical protein